MGPHRVRDRAWLVAGVATVVAAGLATRRFPSVVPDFLGKYPGDALWALMVFLGLALIRPGARTVWLAVGALVFCFAVEASQAYHAPWLDAVRATTVGHLVLGSAFGWWDLLAYAVGVGAGVGGDLWWRRRARPTP